MGTCNACVRTCTCTRRCCVCLHFVWHARTIQVAELSKLLVDLGLGEGDVDLDEALAEMEIENVDDNLDSTLNKAEFFRWFGAKKSELKASAPQAEGSAAAAAAAHHEAARDLNAWGEEPKHHAAAVKIQAVARGRLNRKTVTSEDGEIEVIDDGNEETQGSVRWRARWRASCSQCLLLPLFGCAYLSGAPDRLIQYVVCGTCITLRTFMPRCCCA
jgi:hypothetical protein